MSAIERRKATLKKIENDAQTLRAYARFVLVLDEHGGVEVVDNEQLFTDCCPYASLIAVVGPLEYEGQKLQETVLLEIGYNRTRPYLRVQFKSRRPRININVRHRIRELRDEEIKIVYPYILECMSAIVLERRSRWKEKDALNLGYRDGLIERGICFTFSKKDRWLHCQMLHEHVRYEEERYMKRQIGWIAKCLKRYRFSYYTPAQLKSYANIDRVCHTLFGQTYLRTLHLETFLALLTRKRASLRPLVDLILLTFGKEVGNWDEETELYFSEPAFRLPVMEVIRCHIVSWQPEVEGKNCFVAEVSLERRYRKQHEQPTTQAVSRREYEESTFEIPF